MSDTVIHRPSETRLTMKTELNAALDHVVTEAEGIAGAASKIAQKIDEVRSAGGMLSIQPQIMFLTGAMARLMKDLGVVEHLQKHGTRVVRARQHSFER